jgi:hypothetical protein
MGKIDQARDWLLQQSEYPPEYFVLLALSHRDNHLYHWEKAIEALQVEGFSPNLLLAYKRAAKYSRIGFDHKKQINHLHGAIQTAKAIQKPFETLELQAILGNTLLQLGDVNNAEKVLTECVQHSIKIKHDLLVIAEGIVLCGMWMREGKFERVASLCLNIENSAINRCNWIALSSSRMMRASCWMILKSPQKAISLLFETGNFLYQQGAVVALNLIKARLGEIQLLIGEEKFEQYRQQN